MTRSFLQMSLFLLALGLMLSPTVLADDEKDADDIARAEERHQSLLEGLNGEDEPRKLSDRQVDLYWRQHAGRYANAYAVVDGKYVACPKWNAAFPSSRHETVQSFLAKNAKREKESAGALVYTRTTTPPRDEAEAAANVLPDLAVGEYGVIHGGRVVKILGPEQMIVEDIQLIDAAKVRADQERETKQMKENVDEQVKRIEAERKREAALERALDGDFDRRDRRRTRYERIDKGKYYKQIDKYIEQRYEIRNEMIEKQSDFRRTKLHVIGIPTRSVQVGDQWGDARIHRVGDLRGTAIAIVGESEEKRSRYRRTPDTLIAIPVTALRQGITLNQFEQVVQQAGMSKENFAYLHIRETKADPQAAIAKGIEFIENLRAKRAEFVKFDPAIAREGERVSPGDTTPGGASPRDTGSGDDSDTPRKPLKRVIY